MGFNPILCNTQQLVPYFDRHKLGIVVLSHASFFLSHVRTIYNLPKFIAHYIPPVYMDGSARMPAIMCFKKNNLIRLFLKQFTKAVNTGYLK